jgi:MFS transporter, putative metabolite:H+ symporter
MDAARHAKGCNIPTVQEFMETVMAPRRSGIEFHHPIAFWAGTLMLGAGVLAHLPMFMMAAPVGFRMVDMPVDGTMIAGMFLIVAGLVLSVYGLIPRRLELNREEGPAISLVSADNAPLTRAHGTLLIVLIVALVVDIMKPATLGFVMPGMADEYGISRQTASWLAISALTGTAVGSVIWGLIADILGRRCAILISSLMFVGTAICGSMPAFEWNLFMCFLMGASAGGLLPIAFTLMAETVPSRHRGWMLVLLGGIGTTGGYLAASLCAAWLEPQFGWRVLWFLNFPTGLLLIALNRFLPESPRFLAHIGRNDEARHVLESYGVTVVTSEQRQVHDPSHHWMQSLFGRPVFALTAGLVLCGLAWGLVNFGFLLWLPSNLRGLGMVGGTAEALLAKSAILALPGVLLVTWLYHKWSTIRTIVLFVAVTAAALIGFFLLESGAVHSSAWFVVLTVVLLMSISGVIAMLIPYATEIYPLQVRGTGSGLVAGSSKAGGIAAAGLGVMGLFGSLAASSLIIAVVLAASAILLAAKGIETRNRDLDKIHPGDSKAA